MVDNVPVTAGVGTDIATEDVSGVHHQKVKVEFGADGAASLVDKASGLGLPVQGEAAENAATTGNPVLSGGRYDSTPRTLGDGDVGAIAIDPDGHILVREENVISTNNSSTANLANGVAFTGTGDDVSQDAAITCYIEASHDSATDGISFQFSDDNSNWDSVTLFTYTAADGARIFQLPVVAQYFRIVYTNGGTTTTHLRIQTILHVHPVNSTVHRLVENVDPDRPAELVKAALIAQQAGTGDFVPVQSSASGNLKVDVEENVAGSAGDVAHDAADSGNPVKVGGRATNSIEGRTQVANNDRTDILADLNGVLIVREHTTLEEIIIGRTTNTDGASTALTNFTAGGADVHNYLTSISLANSSATDITVDLRSGTGGAVLYTIPVPAGGGVVQNFPVPLKFLANTAVAFDGSAAVTTLTISAIGFQAQG
jgi:hypothetical protein